MAESDNPKLPGGLRIFSGAVILVLLVGAGLFFVPGHGEAALAVAAGALQRALPRQLLSRRDGGDGCAARVEPLVAGPDDPGHGLRLHAGGDGHLAHQSRSFQFRPQSVLAVVRGLCRLGGRGGPVPVERARHAAGQRCDVGRWVAALFPAGSRFCSGSMGSACSSCLRPSARSGHGRSTPSTRRPTARSSSRPRPGPG